MIELIGTVGFGVSTLCAFLHARHTIRQNKHDEELFLTEVKQRKDSLRELERKNKCKHSEWEEVAVEKTGELVAYLCLNPKCTEPLYPDEWNPSGCHCAVAEEKYKTACPVSYHSGKAKLAEAMKPKPAPSVAISGPIKGSKRKVLIDSCGCEDFITRTHKMLRALLREDILTYTRYEEIYRAMLILHPRVHKQGTHYREFSGLDVWLHAGEQIALRPKNPPIPLADFKEVVAHIVKQVAAIYEVPSALTSYHSDDWETTEYVIQNGWGREVTRFKSAAGKDVVESYGGAYLKKQALKKKGY